MKQEHSENERTILIADDHPVVRQGLRDAPRSAPEFSVIAEKLGLHGTNALMKFAFEHKSNL